MADREKVMTWLEICGKNRDYSGTCPYSENGFGEYGQCRETLMADALELLKEQEDALEQMRLDNTDLRNCNAELLKEQEAVVRCKDCKRHYTNGGNCEQVLSDWFCADGERTE